MNAGGRKRDPADLDIPLDEAIRFYAIGDWGNPSRRLKRVAKAM
jgi:hypothetical protein